MLGPPGLNTTSLLNLNKRFTNLSVIDVQNTTSIFNRTSVWLDRSSRITDIELWGAVTVSSLLGVLALLGLGMHAMYRRGCSQVAPRHLLAYLDYRSGR